jgi:hypothetical protein
VVRIVMAPELSSWIAERIASFPDEAPDCLRWLAPSVAEYAALPLYVGWWETTAIRANGEIVSWSTEDEWSGYSGVRPVEERYDWLGSLVDGSRRYEPLQRLLPPRPANAIDCPHLASPFHAEDKIRCPECCGLGWIEPYGPRRCVAHGSP